MSKHTNTGGGGGGEFPQLQLGAVRRKETQYHETHTRDFFSIFKDKNTLLPPLLICYRETKVWSMINATLQINQCNRCLDKLVWGVKTAIFKLKFAPKKIFKESFCFKIVSTVITKTFRNKVQMLLLPGAQNTETNKNKNVIYQVSQGIKK